VRPLDRRERKVEPVRTLGCLLALLASSPCAWAGQEQTNEAPPPETAQQAATPLQRAFQQRPVVSELNAISDWMRKQLQDSPAFIRDTQLIVKPRTYFFDQVTSQDYAVQELKNQAAKLGAKGVLLESTGEKTTSVVSGGTLAIPIKAKTVSGKAIFGSE
jgi:hypothetical protein